jgi:hypothetical protein
LLHQNLKPLRSFPQVTGVVALQFMIVEVCHDTESDTRTA